MRRSDAHMVVPYVEGGLATATRDWAQRNGARLHLVSHDDDAYWRALCEWWTQPGDLMIVEQDIVPLDGVAETMVTCDHDWCASPYDIAPGMRWGLGLGCTKFSQWLRAEHPDMALKAGEPLLDPEPPRVWWVLDTRLSYRLLNAGHQPHGHAPCRHLRVDLAAVR